MKTKIHSEYLYNKYTFILLIIILFIFLLYLFCIKNGNSFLEKFNNKDLLKKNNEKKIKLSCTRKNNKLICNNDVNEEEIISKVYIPLNVDKGTSKKNSNGFIKFDKTFSKIPNVYTQSVLDEDVNKNNESTNVNVYNITKNGFFYQKNKLESDEETGLTGLRPDNKNIFSWLAL